MTQKKISPISSKGRIIRILWGVVYNFLIRPVPRQSFQKWIHFWLRLFGASIHPTARVYSTAKIYFPANLRMKAHSCLGPYVDCYNVDCITLHERAIVSQNVYLCTASHDYTLNTFPLVTSPIDIGAKTWIAASAFIGLGVSIGEGAVVGATASVYKDVDDWSIVGGNPARFIKKRIVNPE